MEDRRTAITACPTISKTPLDLYRLYVYVKERGGFVEVCKVSVAARELSSHWRITSFVQSLTILSIVKQTN